MEGRTAAYIILALIFGILIGIIYTGVTDDNSSYLQRIVTQEERGDEFLDKLRKEQNVSYCLYDSQINSNHEIDSCMSLCAIDESRNNEQCRNCITSITDGSLEAMSACRD